MLDISVSDKTYLGNNINMTCFITPGRINFYDVYQFVVWKKNGSIIEDDYSISKPGTFYSIINFASLQLNNSGMYECATVPNAEPNSTTSLFDTLYLSVSGKLLSGIIHLSTNYKWQHLVFVFLMYTIELVDSISRDEQDFP